MNITPLNYVDVGDHGTFRPSPDVPVSTTPANVDQIFAAMQAGGKKKLLLYFHGGLVNYNSAIASADLIVNELITKTDDYPIAFIWETGIAETIEQNMSDISGTDFFQKLIGKIIKIAGDKLGTQVTNAAGTQDVGSMDPGQINAELQKPVPFDSATIVHANKSLNVNSSNDQFLKDEIRIGAENEIQGDPEFNGRLIDKLSPKQKSMISSENVLNVPAPGADGVFSLGKIIESSVVIVFNVIKRFQSGRDHGFFPTVVEEILRQVYLGELGLDLWTDMKSKAQEMWQADDPGTTGNDQHAGRYLLTKLNAYAENNPGVTVDLVGHSAGAIVICWFVSEFLSMGMSPNVTIRDIIFMAPACRSDLFNQTIVPNQAAFGDFRMFTMTDYYETRDFCGSPLLYSHSLLYLISGILEPNENDAYILGMQRYLTNNWPYNNDPLLLSIIAFMAAQPNRIVYTIIPASTTPGLQCTAVHHGDFHDDQYLVMGSIDYMLMP
jgi:hypothetical protein